MASSFATFERLKGKGLDAYRGGDYAAARTYLLEAAQDLLELAGQARTPEVRRQQEQYASELLALVRECRRAPGGARRRALGRGGVAARTASDADSASNSDWVVHDKPNIGFDQLAGLQEVKQEIRLKMIYPLQYPELAERYGIQSGGGILLYGPPGTGKTMMARAIAGELDSTFFVISPAHILTKWVGEPEQNLRKLFDAARREELAVIFMDELEALVPRRRSDSSGVMQRVVPQILQELEGFRGRAARVLFVGATNRPWMLDEAMLRPGRLDARIYVPLPDADARRKLLEMYLARRPIAEGVSLDDLVHTLDGYSGADIASICERAARAAFLESIDGGEARLITRRDIEQVVHNTLPSVQPRDVQEFDHYSRTGQWPGAQTGEEA